MLQEIQKWSLKLEKERWQIMEIPVYYMEEFGFYLWRGRRSGETIKDFYSISVSERMFWGTCEG